MKRKATLDFGMPKSSVATPKIDFGIPTRNRGEIRIDLKILSILSVFDFGGDRFATSFNRRAQRVPREAGAFDAGGELAHAGEDFQAS
jgi:hypothetical protein